ncbi:MAG: hypothetical protein H8D84_00140 [Proteobacteria bacterium]|jgi:hypothetical protein|nr:hypothetical protein [Pseudomonadota bacterium]
MNKIKDLIRKIDSARETFSKIALLKELDDEVTRFKKEMISKWQKEQK